MPHKTPSKLIDRVIESITKDLIENKDETVLEELLTFVSKENLIQSLPEEEWDEYR